MQLNENRQLRVSPFGSAEPNSEPSEIAHAPQENVERARNMEEQVRRSRGAISMECESIASAT